MVTVIMIMLILGGIIGLNTIRVSAETFTGRFNTGNLTYGFAAGPLSNDGLNALATQMKKWAKFSSNVTLSSASSYSSAKIKVNYQTITPPSSGTLGMTILYDINGNELASTNMRWFKAKVIVYSNAKLKTTTNKYATLIHETGHALSMAHCYHPNENHIMHQGVKDFTTISFYESSEFMKKWGA